MYIQKTTLKKRAKKKLQTGRKLRIKVSPQVQDQSNREPLIEASNRSPDLSMPSNDHHSIPSKIMLYYFPNRHIFLPPLLMFFGSSSTFFHSINLNQLTSSY